MQLGMIGLGRMGANMSVRLMRAGHELCVYDAHSAAVQDLTARGAKGATDLAAFVIVGWTAQGSVSFNWRYTNDCPMARTLIPPYVAELTRRYVVSREEASERFNEMFEWIE